jgi:alkylated DNA repair dioxygenase AlkB
MRKRIQLEESTVSLEGSDYDTEEGYELSPSCKEVTISNVIFRRTSGPAVKLNFGDDNNVSYPDNNLNSTNDSANDNVVNIVLRKCKFIGCAHKGMIRVKSQKDADPLKWINAAVVVTSSDALYQSQPTIANGKKTQVELVDCDFQEIGYTTGNVFDMSVAAVYVSNCDTFIMRGCTIDGVVGVIQSYGVALSNVENAVIDDIFITDVYAGRDARPFYFWDSNAQVFSCQQTGILSNISPEHFDQMLNVHPSYKDEPSNIKDEPSNVKDKSTNVPNAKDNIEDKRENIDHLLEASHLRNIVPKHQEKEPILYEEMKWREFRTLGRQVCHQAQKRSPTTALYADWVERMCLEIFQVHVKVAAAFANLYEDGTVHLPMHRDQYRKWVIGLSFGETRTFQFVKDETEEVFEYEMNSGDVLIFAPSINNHFQHRMLPEPERRNRRINLTFFVDILDDSQKPPENLLTPLKKEQIALLPLL